MTSLPGSPLTRGFLATVILTTVLIAAMVGAGVAAWQGTRANSAAIERASREAEEATKQSERNETLLRIVLAVTGCRIEDTPEECAERVRKATQAEGDRRLVQVDCRMRAALAGKPAPSVGESC